MRSSEVLFTPTILIATPDTVYGTALERYMEIDDCVIERCHDPEGVLRLVRRRPIDILILDLALNENSAQAGGQRTADVDLVSFVERQSPRTHVILVYDLAQVERAIEGIRHGAYFHLPKSCDPADVALVVEKAVRDLALQTKVDDFERALLEEMAGTSPAMKRVVEIISKVAPTDSTVLLLGESGTGKEVFANAIHRLSPRRDRPFIAINCAALPEALLESEMFGHVKGAFTGAHKDKAGLFEEADGGTLFLDEIGDMAPAMQAKLLRVLQNGEVRRVGDSTVSRVDVRILAATNRNLVEAVAENTFREDLYYRLNVIQVLIPPLRERLEALPGLLRQFLTQFNARYAKKIHSIDENTRVLLSNYHYPGNIRELESIIAHGVILCDGDTITARDLPDQIRFGKGARRALPHYATDDIPTLQEMEKQLIETALEKLNGNQTEVAKRMGVSRSTLWRKMKEYGLSRTAETPDALP